MFKFPNCKIKGEDDNLFNVDQSFSMDDSDESKSSLNEDQTSLLLDNSKNNQRNSKEDSFIIENFKNQNE